MISVPVSATDLRLREFFFTCLQFRLLTNAQIYAGYLCPVTTIYVYIVLHLVIAQWHHCHQLIATHQLIAISAAEQFHHAELHPADGRRHRHLQHAWHSAWPDDVPYRFSKNTCPCPIYNI